jgi:hypothetical protein
MFLLTSFAYFIGRRIFGRACSYAMFSIVLHQFYMEIEKGYILFLSLLCDVVCLRLLDLGALS